MKYIDILDLNSDLGLKVPVAVIGDNTGWSTSNARTIRVLSKPHKLALSIMHHPQTPILGSPINGNGINELIAVADAINFLNNSIR